MFHCFVYENAKVTIKHLIFHHQRFINQRLYCYIQTFRQSYFIYPASRLFACTTIWQHCGSEINMLEGMETSVKMERALCIRTLRGNANDIVCLRQHHRSTDVSRCEIVLWQNIHAGGILLFSLNNHSLAGDSAPGKCIIMRETCCVVLICRCTQLSTWKGECSLGQITS